ncbi:MAG: hypothetical protein KC493_12295 [Bacteriovoracaceae bacterium]|nr:hypothetical protein [Bacteriovoracaceae bacterium]
MNFQNKKTNYLVLAFLSCLTLSVLISPKEIMSVGSVILGAMTLSSTVRI